MRRLPLITEQALFEIRNKRTAIAEDFHTQLTADETQLSCRKGCSHCCHHPVFISLFEGLLLYQWLKKEGLWSSGLKKELNRVSHLVVGLPVETWMAADIACPLLKDDLCIAYKGRPFVCRTTYSSGVPDQCHPHRFGTGTAIVPRMDELREFQDLEKQQMQKHKLAYKTAPLPLAVLIGERLAKGDLEVEDSWGAVLQEYLKAWL